MKETGEQNMRSSKWYAILLTIVLVMSGCCPANAITAAAAKSKNFFIIFYFWLITIFMFTLVQFECRSTIDGFKLSSCW